MRRGAQGGRTGAGFTLVELMVALTLVGILAVLAGPAFRALIQDNRQTSQINGLLGHLNLARSAAVRRGVYVTVCKSADQSSCGGAGVNWEAGWIVFVDNSNQGTRDAGEELLRAEPALAGGNTLRSGNDRVTFRNDGFSPGFLGTWTLCDARGAAKAVGLIVTNAGQIRTAVDGDGDGAREDHGGSPLTCP